MYLIAKNNFVSPVENNVVEVRRFLMRLANGVKTILIVSIEFMHSSFGGFYKVTLCDSDLIYPNVFFSLEQLKEEINVLAHSYNLTTFYITESVDAEIVV
ncbi:MAG: hypothetical protein QM500_00055 [Methylococcales bacterium]